MQKRHLIQEKPVTDFNALSQDQTVISALKAGFPLLLFATKSRCSVYFFLFWTKKILLHCSHKLFMAKVNTPKFFCALSLFQRFNILIWRWRGRWFALSLCALMNLVALSVSLNISISELNFRAFSFLSDFYFYFRAGTFLAGEHGTRIWKHL